MASARSGICVNLLFFFFPKYIDTNMCNDLAGKPVGKWVTNIIFRLNTNMEIASYLA